MTIKFNLKLSLIQKLDLLDLKTLLVVRQNKWCVQINGRISQQMTEIYFALKNDSLLLSQVQCA